uniref:t-SNARE coiled-coil homology domain-containing protein n=1 Tax=Seriola lalandi dorsalis TaxID=1841481 RepID=A0A3B4WW31_SERLL
AFDNIIILVQKLGDIVNNIEQNVSKSMDHIIAAKEQTKKAVRYQTKARKKDHTPCTLPLTRNCFILCASLLISFSLSHY